MSKAPSALRLDRLLANLGYGSRREMQEMVAADAVTLDGEVLHDAGARIAITPDLSARMKIDGRRLDPPPGIALMLHKPLGVTCSHKENGPLVYDLFPSRWKRREPALSSIGRLDKETSGLLLFTDDGDLLHRVISPRNHVSKRYLVTLDRPMSGEEGAVFASGEMMLEEEVKPLLPAHLHVLSETSAWLTVTEGRYHQVRRMFAAVGNHVTALHRDQIGGLALPEDLAAGEYRLLKPEDLALIWLSPDHAPESEATAA